MYPLLAGRTHACRNSSDVLYLLYCRIPRSGSTGNAGGGNPARPDSVRDSGKRVRDGWPVATSGLPPGGHAEGQPEPRRCRIQVGANYLRQALARVVSRETAVIKHGAPAATSTA